MTDYLTRVELRQLETFRAIARAGTFHGAATDMGYSQSVVSQQLAALESVVGLRLIDRGRGKRRIALTQAGSILLAHVEAIEASLGAAAADLQALKDGDAGSIRVGTYQSVSSRILPTLLSRYSRDHASVAVEVRESADDQELLPLLETGELDFAFTAFPLAPGPFEAVEVLRDPWLLLTQADSPLASKPTPLSVRTLTGVPLIGFAASGVVQTMLEDYLRGHGVAPNIIFRTNDNVAVTELVATGFASALMPALTVGHTDDRVARIPVDIPTRSIALAWHSKRTQLPAAATFIAMVQQVCREVAAT